MSMDDLEHALHLIDQSVTIADFEGPKSEALIGSAEAALGLTLPPTYRAFVLRLGCGGIGGEEFYGIINDECENARVPNGIWLTLNERLIASLPESMIIVGDNGIGGWYAIDTSRKNASGDSPVVEWSDDNLPSQIVAEDFGSFLLQQVRQVLD